MATKIEPMLEQYKLPGIDTKEFMVSANAASPPVSWSSI